MPALCIIILVLPLILIMVAVIASLFHRMAVDRFRRDLEREIASVSGEPAGDSARQGPRYTVSYYEVYGERGPFHFVVTLRRDNRSSIDFKISDRHWILLSLTDMDSIPHGDRPIYIKSADLDRVRRHLDPDRTRAVLDLFDRGCVSITAEDRSLEAVVEVYLRDYRSQSPVRPSGPRGWIDEYYFDPSDQELPGFGRQAFVKIVEKLDQLAER